jgi:hypothetical protein
MGINGKLHDELTRPISAGYIPPRSMQKIPKTTILDKAFPPFRTPRRVT